VTWKQFGPIRSNTKDTLDSTQKALGERENELESTNGALESRKVNLDESKASSRRVTRD